MYILEAFQSMTLSPPVHHAHHVYHAYLEPLRDTSEPLYHRIRYVFDLLETLPYDYLATHPSLVLFNTTEASVVSHLANLLGQLTDRDPLVLVAYKQWVQRMRLHPYYTETKMPFGKHKGESLTKVPLPYLLWLLDSDSADGNFTTLAGEDVGWASLLRKARDLVQMTPKAVQDAYHGAQSRAHANALYQHVSDVYDNWVLAMRFL
jgi:hypothetical protein